MADAAAKAVESLSVSNPDNENVSVEISASSSSSQLSLEQKFQIVRSIGEECIQEDELRNLLEKKPEPVCYDGFEPSGRMHIAQVQAMFHFQLLLNDVLLCLILESLLSCNSSNE